MNREEHTEEEKLDKFIQMAGRERELYQARKEEIDRKYPEQYILLIDGEVVDHDPDHKRLQHRVVPRLREDGRNGLILKIGKHPLESNITLPISIIADYNV